jgi:hypothetical protein
MGYNGFFFNILFAGLTFFFGGIGMFFTRYMKGSWSKAWWDYIPILWILLEGQDAIGPPGETETTIVPASV